MGWRVFFTRTGTHCALGAAPIRRHAATAVQLRFLRTIAPIEILVRAERRRALQLFVVDVEFVGFEFDVVAQAAGSESPTMVHGNTARRHCRAGPPQELAV